MENKGDRNSRGCIYLLMGIILSCCSVHPSSALSLTVADAECVYEYVFFDGDTISGSFVVVDHGLIWGPRHQGINFEVKSPSGDSVYTLMATTGDKFELKGCQRGMYKFCFYNPTSDPEAVSFHIHVGHIPSEHHLAKNEHLNPINVRIAHLREALESVSGEQKYLKARDTRHRHMNENTRKRLIMYTVLEYVLLVVASGSQVLIIHRLFGKSVGYNRV